jgi:hypothetical protein
MKSSSGFKAVLFCAVLHEMSDYRGALDSVNQTDIDHILICDYDPNLQGWLRVWMDFFESEARKWWGCKPELFLPGSTWHFQGGRISRSLLFWQFKRRPASGEGNKHG